MIRVADTKTDYAFKIDTFVSQTTIVYPMAWTKNVVPGLHTVQVDLDYEGGRHTTWNGTVNIAGDLQNQLENSLSHIQVKSSSHSSLWLILAAVAGIALFAGGDLHAAPQPAATARQDPARLTD